MMMNTLLKNKRLLNLYKKYSKLSYIHNNGEEPLKPLTVGRLLEKTCVDYGSTPAVISCHQDRSVDFKTVLDEADRLAAGLLRLGFQKGDKIGLWAPNMIEWYTTFMACARGGFIIVSINPYYQKRELEYSINKVGVNALIIPKKNLKKQNFNEVIRSVCPEIIDCRSGKISSKTVPSLRRVITIGDIKEKSTLTYDELLDIANEESISIIRKNQGSIKIDDPCCIQFTSGTTGVSKAPVVSHFSVVNNGYFIGKRNRLNQKQHVICIQNPLFHAYGSVIGILGALNFGSTVVLPSDGYDVEKNLEALKKHRCTVVYGTPTMYIDLINLQKQRKEKLNLEIAVSGGAVCSPCLFENMLNLLGVQQVKSIYGLTETSGCTFQTLDGDDKYKCTETVGYLQEHLEAKIVDKEGNILPRGTIGELCIRGYSVMSNYYGDEEKTKQSIKDNGWFHTGDLFLIDDDGYAKISGRLKDMIIRGGENIYPREIEDFLNTHPDIIQAEVVGVPHKRLGEEVCACLRTKDDKQLTVEDVKEFCIGNIATFKIPSIVKILSDFPKTISGKVEKVKLREMLTNK